MKFCPCESCVAVCSNYKQRFENVLIEHFAMFRSNNVELLRQLITLEKKKHESTTSRLS